MVKIIEIKKINTNKRYLSSEIYKFLKSSKDLFARDFKYSLQETRTT